MLNKKNKIILDTDPGIDDAVAMIVLIRSCAQRIKLILTSYGNISVNHTTQNALTILSLLDSNIPVVKGAESPDNAEYIDASHIHGVDGLGGLMIDSPKQSPVIGDYLKITYDAIIEAGTVDYITLGPLTNLALLIKRFPDVITHIENVVSMGGGLKRGNVTEFAEFNIHCDPQSAEYVFDNISNFTLVPLNTTSRVFFTLDQIEKIGKTQTPLAQAMAKILTANYYACIKYGEHGSTMHDATAVLYYLYDEYFTRMRCGITVDCADHFGETRLSPTHSPINMTLRVSPIRLIEKITDSIV